MGENMFTKKREIFLTRIDRQAFFTKKSEQDSLGTFYQKEDTVKIFLGTVMREARVKAGITLRELASTVGCAPSFLSEVENGLRPAPKDEPLLIRIANALGLEASSVKEAASNDRARRDLKLIKELFAQDDELAACYCRAKEMYDENELKELFKEIFTRATTPNKEKNSNE